MDVLSDVLRVAQLGHAVLARNELLAPWGLLVGKEVRAAVHVVQRGLCWLRIGKEEPVRLVQGDVAFLPHGLSHTLADTPDTPPVPFEEGLEHMAARLSQLPQVPSDAAQEATTLVCADVQFDHSVPNPFIDALPNVIHLSADVAAQDESLQSALRIMFRETQKQRNGTEFVVPPLFDVLLVLVVRAWLERQPAATGGWLGALRDQKIGKALVLIHAAPEAPWTVQGLAEKLGLSRATFARRFAELVGEPPLAYVTRWRMNRAAQLLRTTTLPIEQVASKVGYESTTAFGNAFRRFLMTTPSRYRRAPSHG
ncbi:MAG: AraC family transcriptional regulator [Myxococcales bacterium]|nr:AraC family transcriptional regulator [Myxococcales bacterium]MDD9971801.1 AraC family transcriptional regulator [Myxococcales bacterium]